MAMAMAMAMAALFYVVLRPSRATHSMNKVSQPFLLLSLASWAQQEEPGTLHAGCRTVLDSVAEERPSERMPSLFIEQRQQQVVPPICSFS